MRVKVRDSESEGTRKAHRSKGKKYLYALFEAVPAPCANEKAGPS
jgi:hypothetical protein